MQNLTSTAKHLSKKVIRRNLFRCLKSLVATGSKRVNAVSGIAVDISTIQCSKARNDQLRLSLSKLLSIEMI